VDRSAWIRTKSAPQLAQGREKARELAAHVERFSRRIDELRSLGQTEVSSDPRARCELLQHRIQLQDAELTLALEELRAQKGALEEAYAVLEDERGRYADLFDAAPDACITTDERGIIREANAAAAAMLAVVQRTLPGKLLIAFVARRDTRAFRSKLSVANQQPTQAFSLHLRARGSAPFPASLSVRAFRRARADSLELRPPPRASATCSPTSPTSCVRHRSRAARRLPASRCSSRTSSNSRRAPTREIGRPSRPRPSSRRLLCAPRAERRARAPR